MTHIEIDSYVNYINRLDLFYIHAPDCMYVKA